MTFLLSWATLGYLGPAWATMLTGTRSSERARVFHFFVKIFDFFSKKSFFQTFSPDPSEAL
jgi:hypothetical protein